MNGIKVFIMRLWAKSGKALGWLYQWVDKNAKNMSGLERTARVLSTEFIECNLGDHIQRQIYFFGAYEPIESYLVREILTDDSVVIDAGANIGFYTLLMAQKLKNGKVHSFEPVPTNFQKLKHNISKSKVGGNIEAYNSGLWEKQGELKFSLDAEMDDNIGSFTAGNIRQASQIHTCPVLAIDEVTESFARLDLIKMDIEGAELSALKGAQKSLQKFQPTLLIEINRKASENFGYSPNDLYLFLKDFDYQFYLVQDIDSRSRWINSFDDIVQANVIAVPKGKESIVPQTWDANKIKKYFIDASF